jgi:hypothetical protein
MSKKLILILILALFVSVGSQAQNEQELILEQGLDDYEGVADTSIYSENSNSNGKGSHVFIGVTFRATGERRTLIKFDLSDVPAGARITFARLELSVSRIPGNAQPSTITAHRLTKDWAEGTADAGGQEGRGAISSDGDATWSENVKGESAWSNEGGDFDPQSSASVVAPGSLGRRAWEGEGMIDDVQDWLSGTEDNFGWILMTGEEAKRFNSSDGTAGEGLKPRLTIRFTTPTN